MQKKLAVKITITNNDASIFSTGSGCLYNPELKDYMYVLTAEHCLVGKNGELRDSLTKENIKIQRQEHTTQENYLEVIDYYCYPNGEHDLAIVVVKVVEGVERVKVGMVEEDSKGKFYGFPSPMPNGVLLEYKVMEKEESGTTENFQIRTEDSLDTYLKGAAENCQGFSGSGIYSERNGEKILIGIVTELASPEAAFSRLIGESILKFNYILESNGLVTLNEIVLKSDIQIQLDSYQTQFTSRVARIRNLAHKAKVETSMKEVYDMLINMDIAEITRFLLKYYHPRVSNKEDINILQGIGELWELVTYINCNTENWQLVDYDVSNLEINYEDSQEFINLIYSLEKFSIPIIAIQLGIELAKTPYKKIIFDNLWVIDNYHNIYDDENICINCGVGNNYPFQNLLKDFSELEETGLLRGVDPENNTFKELGNISVICSTCIRRIGAELLIKGKQLVEIKEVNY